MSAPDPPNAPTDPPPPPGPSTPPKGKFKKLLQNIRIASRSLRMSSKRRDKVVDVAKTLTELAAKGVSDAGVPGLAVGIGILDEVLGKIQTMSKNGEGVDDLKGRIEKLKADMATLESPHPDQALPENLRERLASLMKTWTVIGQSAEHIAQRGRFKRFVMSGADADDLESLVEQIKTSIEDFMLHEVLVVGKKVHQMHHMFTAVAAILEDSFIPRYAKRAQYNASSTRRACLPDTRVDILDILRLWILASVAEDVAPDAHHGIVFWISGLAGTGKTTIAYSIAQWCKDQGILGGSFFCSRLDAECRDPSFIFVTLCRQLCQFHAPFQAKVAEAIKKDPSIIHASPSEQFEKLILEPLEELKEAMPKTVIVIDALDECQDQEATSTTLNVLAKFVPRLAQATRRSLVVIATSRPEPRVAVLFKESPGETLSHTTTRLLLHMHELGSVHDDIKRCLKHEFSRSRHLFELGEEWLCESVVEELAALSGRLFIFAMTAMKFIMSPDAAGVPEERMHAILHSDSAARTPEDLTSLYVQIAEAASKAHARFQSPSNSLLPVLGTIALAQEPVSSTLLGHLLGRQPLHVRNTLTGLHSVLHIPEDYSEAIQVIHPTFVEFLLAIDADKPDGFSVVASDQHAFLFDRNLEIMKVLKRNMAGIPSHLLRKNEIPTLLTDVKRRITPDLSYAVRHWTAHLHAAADSLMLAGKYLSLRELLHHRLLFWLEASSLLGALEDATTGLSVAHMTCVKVGNAFTALVPLLADARRFIQAFFACIDAAPLELYHSALGFAPDRSLIKQVYRKELRRAPTARRGVALDWEPCIKTFSAIVDEGATCIDFSPDRSLYVDRKSTICNVTTQKVSTTLDPQIGYVICAAFCPDGQHVALVSSERKTTLEVWHLTSGERVHAFEGHNNVIGFVTYSADGRCLLSADEHEIRLWSVSDRQSLLALPCDLKYRWGIALSPDGSVIALPEPSRHHLRLYSSASHTSERLPLPRKMRTAAFSSDGRYIAASTERTISIWTRADWSSAYLLEVPYDPYRLSFSTDSTRLGVGLHDGSVYLWKVESSEAPVVLHGHTGPVSNVLWSLDDSQIISVSLDYTVRIWDATRSPVAGEQMRLPMDTISLPHSPHPTILCKGEDSVHIFHLPGPAPVEPFRTPDGAPTMTLHANIAEAWDAAFSTKSFCFPDAADLSIARDWELLTGQRHICPQYSPVVLSQDATFIAFRDPSDNKTIRVCNLRTGDAVAPFSCHDIVNSATFSPDGSLLATGSDDHQVCVWDIATQQPVDSHRTHTRCVLAVAFSHGGQLLASGGDDGAVCIYSLADRCTLHTLTFRGSYLSGWIIRLGFSADDAHVIALNIARHVLIGDVVTGGIIRQVSLNTDTWTRTLNLTPNPTGLMVHAEDEQIHKINMDLTEPCIWPVYHVSHDGWVTEKSSGKRARRVCWLPPGWRDVFSLGGSFFCAVDEERRRTAVIDVSEVDGLEVGLSPMVETDLTL